MPDLRPTEEQLSELVRARPDAPDYLVNLLKFREQAIYAKGTPEAEFYLSGIEAFGKFMERFRIVVDELRGGLIFTKKSAALCQWRGGGIVWPS